MKNGEASIGFGWLLFGVIVFGAFMYLNYGYDHGVPGNVGDEEARSFVQAQGYLIKETLGDDLICSQSKTTGDITGVGFVLEKEEKLIHGVVCEFVERVYTWPDNDPLHKFRQEWVDTKRHLVLVEFTP